MSYDYWKEAVDSSLDVHGAYFILTEDQRNAIAQDMRHAAEMKSEATGEINIPNPLKSENEKLTKDLEMERRMIHCRECGGRGRIWMQGPHHGCDSECWKCHRKGKLLP